MKIRLGFWVFLAAASSASGSHNNYAYYKNLAFKALLYPFAQFWNSSKTTKAMLVGVGAVGALVILGRKKLDEWTKETIKSQLKEIDNSIKELKDIKESQDKKTNNNKKLFLKDVSNLNQNLSSLIATTSTLIDTTEKDLAPFLSVYPKQKTKLETLKKEFENITSQLKSPSSN
jgi:hypothetical protein